MLTPEFWIAVGQIIMIDILLGGDNAVVIALACRKLAPAQRTKGIIWGTIGAIVLRVILIFFALTLLAIPFLKIVGAALLVWIGVKLLVPENEGHGEIEASDKLLAAVKTVIVADLVMSVDNVIAIAGAAEGAGGDHQMPLVIFGLLVSIPIIVWGSQLVIRLMDRFPIIITLGGMLLGWIAGTMLVSDPVLAKPDVWTSFPKLDQGAGVRYGFGIAGALLVLGIGKLLAARSAPGDAHAVAEPHVTGLLKRVLLAVDGSDSSMHAVRQLITLRQNLREPNALEVHLINVQRPVSKDVSSFVAGKTLDEYHRERGDKAIAPALAMLSEANLTPQQHLSVGTPGPTIARVAQEQNCDLIVMGARGLGSHTAAVLGSVAHDTLKNSSVPVLVVR